MLAAGDTAAENFDLIAALENRVSGGVDATQTSSTTYQPRAHVPVGGGHLYLPSVSGNSASVTFPSIAADEDFVFEAEVFLVSATNFYLVTGATADHRFAIFDGKFYFASSEFQTLDSSLATGASTLTVERSGSTLTLKQDGVTKATKSSGVSDNAYNFTHLSFNQQFTSSILGLNGYIKTATLSVAGTEELNIDFSNATHGASSFVCSTGQTVSINKAGLDPATIIRRSVARFDGVANYMFNTFSEDVTTAHGFIKFAVNGDTFNNTAPTTLSLFRTDHWLTNAAILYSGNGTTGTNGRTYIAATVMSQSGKWDDANGTIVAEIGISDGNHFSKINNASIQTDSSAYSLNASKFRIGAGSVSGQAPIDIEQIYLFDRVLSSEEAAKVQDYMNPSDSIYRRITDSDALAYIAALEGDGVSVSDTQKEAIEDFCVTAKSGGWYSSLKRLYLPIWGAAAPNARCLVSSTSGTFEGSFTHATGYAHPTAASSANRFNTGYKLLDDLTTEDACLMAIAYDDVPPPDRAINASNKTIIGSGSITANGVRINTTSSSLVPQAVWLGVNESTLPSYGSHGVLLSNRKGGDTTLSRRTASAYDEDSTTGTLTGTYNNNFPITGYGSSSGSTGAVGQATDSKAGAFGIGEGLDATDRAAYTLAVKNLWETCSGLTL